jgi:hypothetical protein
MAPCLFTQLRYSQRSLVNYERAKMEQYKYTNLKEACVTVMVKALHYKPEGREFEVR